MNQGKYVFSQIMEHVPYYEFSKCVKRYNGDRKSRKLSCRDQFLAMAFGQLTYRESLRDIVVCLESQRKKLYHLGFSSPEIKRSTLSDANYSKDWRIYRDLAKVLIGIAKKLYTNSKELNLDLEGAVYAIDSSTIELCLNIFKWARLVKVRASVKLHLGLDLQGNIPSFFDITTGKVHDLNFLDDIILEAGAYYIMDRGYIDFERLYQIDQSGAFFVIRAKKNFAFKRLYSNRVDKDTGVRCDQVGRLANTQMRKKYPDKLRRIKYYDEETDKYFVFLTNNMDIEAEVVAKLYKHRWQIELFFKWIKQHLKIKAFWGYSENAVKTQICIAICVYLLVAIIKKRLNIDRNLYEILQILSVSQLDKTPINTLLSEFDLSLKNDQTQNQPSLLDF